jgi:hypothetical protein
LVLLSPIILLLVAYAYVQEKVNNRKFEAYLTKIEGARYFCYTNRQTSQAYVETNILPYLPPDTEIIYLGDSKRIIILGNETTFAFHIVARMKMAKGGFPYIAKVSQGRLISKSINKELYKAIIRNKDADSINHRIHRFLDRDRTKDR